MIRSRTAIPLLFLVSLAGCAAPAVDPGIVARAADRELTVDEGAAILAAGPDLPASPEVATALADLWIDYVLLGIAVAEDTSLSQLDVAPLVRQQAEQAMITALRDSVLGGAEPIDEVELRGRYEAEAAGSEVRVSHILRTLPPGATAAQRDSVVEGVRDLRRQIVEGAEDFDSAARRYSEDPGTAGRGGELGFVVPGELPARLAEAVSGLEPGGVSEPIVTEAGVHLVRVEERRTPTPEAFRARVEDRRVAVAESTYLAELRERAAVRVQEGAAERVRELARGTADTTTFAGQRALVRYTDGEITAAEVREFLGSRTPLYRSQVAGAPDSLIHRQILEPLVQRELLVREAEREGWAVSDETLEPIPAAARASIRSMARQLGLYPVSAEPESEYADEVENRVHALLTAVVGGERQAPPLGAISTLLRGRYPADVSAAGIEALVSAMQARTDS